MATQSGNDFGAEEILNSADVSEPSMRRPVGTDGSYRRPCMDVGAEIRGLGRESRDAR
jgi:hypothetical protein